MRCSHVLSNEGGQVMFLTRRQFLKASAGTITALAIADKALALTALQPVIEVGNPLGEYPDRSWERVYHDQYRYDSSFSYVCTPNDTQACRVRAFVRNGVVMRVEQNYDHQTYEDLYGNRGTFAHNPRMCLKGYTFHRRVYGPYRLKGPMLRKGWKAWVDDGCPELTDWVGLLTVIGVAMVGSLFAADAWNNVTFVAGEVKDPERTLPRSLALGTGLVIAIYLLTNVAYLCVLPLRGTPDGATVLDRGIQFAAEDRVATAVAEVAFGHSGGVLMALAVMISTFGCNNGLILAGARIYYAMARDHMFFASVGALNRHLSPAPALLVQGAWASVLCLSGTYGQLLDFLIFSVLLFYILTIC